MSYRLRVLLATLGLLVVVIAGILAGIQLVVTREVLPRLAADVESTARVVQNNLRADGVRLRNEARVVGEEPRLKAVINTADVDAATRDDVVGELRNAIGWDLLGLADSEGAVRSLAGPAGLTGSPALISEALGKGEAEGYWFQGDRLFHAVAIRLGFGTQVAGVLLAGNQLGDGRAAELVGNSRVALALFAKDHLAASTLTGVSRSELANWKSPLPSELTLAGEPYLAQEIQLDGPGVRLVVLNSADEAFGLYRRLRRAVVGIGALALILAVGVAAILSRGWSRPIARLVEMAQSVKAGNLEARVKPSGGRELVGLGTTLNEMVGEISRQRRRDELASFLVHDLKNPITGVLANAQMIDLTGISHDDQESVEGIVSSAETMLSMVIDLLDVGNDSDGSLVPKKAVFDLYDLIDQVHRDAAVRAKRRRIEVTVQREGPRNIRADRDLLRRVLENLLDNAFKYAPEGGRIFLDQLPGKDGTVVLRVRDEGAGIPEEFKLKIFDKFFRLDQHAAQQARTSRGLGLAFCRVAVEAHQGRIWVEDNQPRGTSFCISLPQGT
jgi:signal transduction histidine kinase